MNGPIALWSPPVPYARDGERTSARAPSDTGKSNMKWPAILLGVLLSFSVQAEPLVSYSFDDSQPDTGPDTFRIFENSRGIVRLSSEYRYSGYYSIEIRDVAQDGDFPELQGYFPAQKAGEFNLHFAFMTPEPSEPFNMALAGQEHFSMKRDGIGFWLKNERGYLYHVSGNDNKRLVAIEPFTWYLVDLRYRVDAGTYDLAVHEEHVEQPLVDLKGIANATGSPASTVNMFSFIGDLPDTGAAIVYVDDIEIHSDRIVRMDLVAPGRRKLFVDYWQDLEREERGRPQCVGATSLKDFGIDSDRLPEWRSTGNFIQLEQIMVAATDAITPEVVEDLSATPRLRAVATWRLGCRLLEQEKGQEALLLFRQAEAAVPDARIYHLSTTLALASLGEFEEADNRIGSSYGAWYGDERFAAAQAMIGLARGEDWTSETVLQEAVGHLLEYRSDPSVADLWADGPGDQRVEVLREHFPDRWKGFLRERLLVEQYYFLLLWRGAYSEALQFAQQVADLLEYENGTAGIWYEFLGNAAFLAGETDLALDFFELAIEESEGSQARTHNVYLKLSDLFYRTGDLEKERFYREKVYGSLQEASL